MVNVILSLPNQVHFWLVAYVASFGGILTIGFYTIVYRQLAKRWDTLRMRATLSSYRRRCLMTGALCRAINTRIHDHERVSKEFDSFTKAFSLPFFYSVFLSLPCNCVGLYLVIYLRSSPPNWIIAVAGTATVSLLWAVCFLAASECNRQVK